MTNCKNIQYHSKGADVAIISEGIDAMVIIEEKIPKVKSSITRVIKITRDQKTIKII